MELPRRLSTLLAAAFLAASCVELLPNEVQRERVVYTLYGGQPKLHTEETSRQPLGPFQNMDAVGKLVH